MKWVKEWHQDSEKNVQIHVMANIKANYVLRSNYEKYP